MKTFSRGLALAFGAALAGAAHGVTLGFDDLPTAPAINSATGLFFANNDSASYGGVVWESGFTVAGSEYRVDTGSIVDPVRPPGPLFGIPRSGQYFLTNSGNGVSNDAMLLTTSLVLTEAWFGRNEYYGFGGGADQITIHAMAGVASLGSVSFELPELNPAQPEMLGKVDTSVFKSLAGITGYRIDRRELGSQSGNWVADDFTFVTAVPEPGVELLLAGLVVVGLTAHRKRGRRVA